MAYDTLQKNNVIKRIGLCSMKKQLALLLIVSSYMVMLYSADKKYESNIFFDTYSKKSEVEKIMYGDFNPYFSSEFLKKSSIEKKYEILNDYTKLVEDVLVRMHDRHVFVRNKLYDNELDLLTLTANRSNEIQKIIDGYKLDIVWIFIYFVLDYIGVKNDQYQDYIKYNAKYVSDNYAKKVIDHFDQIDTYIDAYNNLTGMKKRLKASIDQNLLISEKDINLSVHWSDGITEIRESAIPWVTVMLKKDGKKNFYEFDKEIGMHLADLYNCEDTLPEKSYKDKELKAQINELQQAFNIFNNKLHYKTENSSR